MMTRRIQLLDVARNLAAFCLVLGCLATLPVRAQVGPPPVITVHPLSQTVILHDKVSFVVVASSQTAITYQWRKNGVDIPGANASTYTIDRVEMHDQGFYSVKVTNAGGLRISNDASLTVLGAPVITSQPLNQLVTQGQPATFSVTASGVTPLMYQWSFNGMPLIDATNSTLTLPNVQPPDMGSYSVVIRNPYGAAVSAPAMLNMEPVGFVIMVFNANDTGPGSLRQALINANANPGPHTIVFGIPGTGPFTINVLSPLPVITNSVTIDATTQPGFAGRPVVVVNGLSSTGDGLYITAGNCTVKGLAIHSFPGSGIVLAMGSSNMIQGNFIGTDSSGQAKKHTGNHALMISNSAWNIIGGTDGLTRNVVVSSKKDGIHLEGAGAHHNQVLGNIVGMAWTGLIKGDIWGNGIVVLDAASNSIGGTDAGAGNLSSWPWGDCLVIAGSNACFNRVQGNLLGTDITGIRGIGGGNGIIIRDAASNTVGGLTLAAANVIAYQAGNGVAISGGAAQFNVVQGNFVGTDRSGTAALLNMNGGVKTTSAFKNTVGGLAPGAGNTIAFNKIGGVIVSDGQCAILGNSLYSNAGDEIGLLNGGNSNALPPVLTGAVNDLTSTRLQGSLSSISGATFRVEFFASPTSDGDGKTFLGAASVTTDSSGVGLVNTVLITGDITAQFVTATATDLEERTSQFSAAIAVTFESPPLITSEPQSVSGVVGSTATLTVIANAKLTPAYQWYSQGGMRANATNADLVFNSLAPSDTGDYYVVVANSAGSVTSAVATVTVLIPPAIAAQPQNQSAVEGQDVTFSVTATGTAPLSYQWTFNGMPLPGGNEASITLQSVDLADAGEYRVVITNEAGSITSDATSLAVSVLPTVTPLYLSSPQMTSTGFTFHLSATAGYTYVILASTNCQDWTPISTNLATTTNVAFTDAEAANYAVRFYRARTQ